MIVVDLGCATHGFHASVPVLLSMYRPGMLYGFDPLLTEDAAAVTAVGETPCEFKREAAWIFDGQVPFKERGSSSHVGGGPDVPCFDFSAWLARTTPDGDVVLKMDVEGAENELLPRMIRDGTNQLVSELLIEWHDAPKDQREHLADSFGGVVKEWWL